MEELKTKYDKLVQRTEIAEARGDIQMAADLKYYVIPELSTELYRIGCREEKYIQFARRPPIIMKASDKELDEIHRKMDSYKERYENLLQKLEAANGDKEKVLKLIEAQKQLDKEIEITREKFLKMVKSLAFD